MLSGFNTFFLFDIECSYNFNKMQYALKFNCRTFYSDYVRYLVEGKVLKKKRKILIDENDLNVQFLIRC